MFTGYLVCHLPTWSYGAENMIFHMTDMDISILLYNYYANITCMFCLYAKQGPFSAKLSTIQDSILEMLNFQANWLMLHNPPNKGAITKSNKIRKSCKQLNHKNIRTRSNGSGNKRQLQRYLKSIVWNTFVLQIFYNFVCL